MFFTPLHYFLLILSVLQVHCSVVWKENKVFGSILATFLVGPNLAVFLFAGIKSTRLWLIHDKTLKDVITFNTWAKCLRKEQSTFKVALAIAASFYIFWLPWTIMQIIVAETDWRSPDPLAFLLTWVGHGRSTINLALLVAFNDSFRKVLKRVLKKTFTRRVYPGAYHAYYLSTIHRNSITLSNGNNFTCSTIRL